MLQMGATGIEGEDNNNNNNNNNNNKGISSRT
jgi:hypothetical protein